MLTKDKGSGRIVDPDLRIYGQSGRLPIRAPLYPWHSDDPGTASTPASPASRSGKALKCQQQFLKTAKMPPHLREVA
jgi:hypothetical protein